jgi:outer membrane protein assembly factor BamB
MRVLRLLSAALLFSLAGGLVAWCEHAAGQVVAQPVEPGGKKKGEEKIKDKDLRPEEDWDIPFAPPYERDATNQLKGARDYLTFKNPPWNTVVPLLQNILNAKSDSFFNIKDKVGDKTLTRRISVKTEANRIISAFPKEGLEFYQQQYGQEAATLLDDAVKANYDMAMLSDVSQRYFHTRAGAEGTVLLGSLYLERGNYLEAAYAFERLLARPNTEEVLTARTLFKAALAFKRSGDPRHADLARNVTDQLQKATARNGLQIGRRTFNFEQLKAELDRQVTSIRPAYAVNEWNGRYGNPERNGLVEGGPPFLVPAFKPVEMLIDRRDKDREANDWIREELSRQFDRENAKAMKSLPLPGFFPITTPDMVIYRSFDGVHAVATRDHTAIVKGEPKLVRAGDTKWISRTKFGFHQIFTLGEDFVDPQVRESATQWWNTYKSPSYAANSLLFENPLLGGIAHDGQNVYFLDDLALPPPPQLTDPNFGWNPGMQVRVSGELSDASREGELIAVNINSGVQQWSLGRIVSNKYTQPPPLPRLNEDEADKSTNAFHLCLHAIFLGPPLPLNGRLYVLIELDGIVRLLCLDPKNLVAVKDWHMKAPTLIWSQKLGRPNNTLPGDSIRRFQGAFLAAGEGILLCPTNSGMVVGVDIMSRSLLWAHSYKKLDPPKPPTYDPQTGMMRQAGPQLNPERWRGAAPIVAGGRAILAAYDSPTLDCIDVRTGKLYWRIPRQAEDLYVGGVVNDKVIIVSRSSVRAYHLTGEKDLTPKVAWEKSAVLAGAMPTGHGIASKNSYYLPVRPDNAAKDNVPAAEIWAINVDTGAITSKTGARVRKDGGTELARYGLGNLVFQDGMVIAQSAHEIAVYPQLELKEAEMNRLLKANPKDPKGLFNRGEIHLDKGKIDAAIADFKDAESNNPPAELKAALKDKLYVAFSELLRERFSEGEKYLAEYEKLCTVEIEPDLEPFEVKRREDESLRRKRIYYYLLARGRESQKRLNDAFDDYLKLAALGEGRQLQEMPDEPNVKMRPDVWARGRIEAMIRNAADPVARKSLEERVNKEWQDVLAKNDRKKLQEFVDVFGPYFPSGALAELKLAEMQIASGAEEDSRDAQVHLSQLRVTAEDPVVRARATEMLARMMVKNQMMEDAVGLYLQLGKEYPTVMIRDGKTGTDFLTDLLTDRRLLPYLEASRYPLPPKMKVDEIRGQNNFNIGQQFDADPVGDLFPMYKRLRFSFDMVASGNGTWSLRFYDRATGLERGKFTDIHAPMQYNPGNWQSAKYVQGSGNMLLVQVGNWVYCLDLAEKNADGRTGKERWRKNLLGEGVNLLANQIMDNGEGDVFLHFQDESRQPIGHVSLIQPGYACLLTRDGLEVIEPVSRKQLWTRRNVSESTRIFGDARHILIVDLENNSIKKPKTTRLIRAVDGVTVEGSKDVGPLMAAAKSYQIHGRHLLLQETVGEKQVLRLLDIANGKDVWKREYDAKAVPVRSTNDEWTGFVKSNGDVEILATMTGKPIAEFKLDPKYGAAHLKDCVEAQLLSDSDRFYLVLGRQPQGAAVANRRNLMYNFTLKSMLINGPMYAFDRGTGRRLWYVDDILDNQWLILERFADLPVIICAAPTQDKNGNQFYYKAVVIEKEQGAVRFNKGLPNNGNYFQSMTVDWKNGEVNLNRYDVRLKISPAEKQ